jgi:uncharacterized protein (TIGR02300 family)
MGSMELGSKRTCAGCGGRFYDLNRSPGICPKCGVEQPLEKLRAPRPSRSTFASQRPYRQPDAGSATDEAGPASASDAEDADSENGEAAVEPDEDEDDDDVTEGPVTARW